MNLRNEVIFEGKIKGQIRTQIDKWNKTSASFMLVSTQTIVTKMKSWERSCTIWIRVQNPKLLDQIKLYQENDIIGVSGYIKTAMKEDAQGNKTYTTGIVGEAIEAIMIQAEAQVEVTKEIYKPQALPTYPLPKRAQAPKLPHDDFENLPF